MSRRSKAILAIIVVLASAAIGLNRLNASRARWYAEFCARSEALVGLPQADAERALTNMVCI